MIHYVRFLIEQNKVQILEDIHLVPYCYIKVEVYGDATPHLNEIAQQFLPVYIAISRFLSFLG